MEEENQVRIDKWLWAVRVFKTRSQAADACRKGKVFINDSLVKPSRFVHVNEIVTVKKLPVVYTYRVKQLLHKRLGAKWVSDYMEDITPEDEKNKRKIEQKNAFFVRDRGAGRPTKKERREMEKIWKNSKP